jgi:hypothetical protein
VTNPYLSFQWKGGVHYARSRVELGNLLDNFKIGILISLSSQLDILQTKKKQDEENATLAFFCSKCRKKTSITRLSP